jgi:hypothetical protein
MKTPLLGQLYGNVAGLKVDDHLPSDLLSVVEIFTK